VVILFSRQCFAAARVRVACYALMPNHRRRAVERLRAIQPPWPDTMFAEPFAFKRLETDYLLMYTSLYLLAIWGMKRSKHCEVRR